MLKRLKYSLQPAEMQRLARLVVVSVVTSLVSQSLGLVLGAGLQANTAVFLGPVTLIPTLLFSGQQRPALAR